jgi:hypothetical protein
MTLITLPNAIWYPNPAFGSALLAQASAATLDAAGEYVAYVFRAEEAMTISHFGFRPSTITASGTVDMRIETVGADGNPSGALWAANTNIAGDTLTTNTWYLGALTASASIAAGDMVAAVIAYNSGTSVQVGHWTGAVAAGFHGAQAYRVISTGGSAAKNLGLGNAAIGSSATAFYHIPIILPGTTETDTNFASGSSPNRYGIRFKVPFACRLSGFSFNTQLNGDFNAVLYSDAGASLQSQSVDGDTYNDGEMGAITFDTPQTLTADTWYRATIEATEAGVNQEVQTITLPSADYIDATPWGSNAHLTTHNGAAWDDTNTDIIPLMSLLIDQIDDGEGDGGGGAEATPVAVGSTTYVMGRGSVITY